MTIVLYPQSESMTLNKLVKSEQKLQWQIANALGTDQNSSVQLSMKAVSSFDNLLVNIGFAYCTSNNIRLRGLLYVSFDFWTIYGLIFVLEI